jgi:hypothetical protein
VPDTTQAQEISTLHLEMRVRGVYAGSDVELVSPMATCGSGCRVQRVEASSDDVEILRFAKDGIAPMPVPLISRGLDRIRRSVPRLGGLIGVKWLVTMEDGVGLRGSITGGSGPEERIQSGGTLRLGGRMIVTLQAGSWSRPRRLMSRKEAILEGSVPAWPPREGTIELANGPIQYYDALEVDRPEAGPVLIVVSNTVKFGLDEVSLLTATPQIRFAALVGEDGGPWERSGAIRGVELRWDDTRELVHAPDPPVRFYHVYRCIEGDDFNGWIRVRSLPADVSSWSDYSFDGTRAALYLVVHAAQYPFGYRYESLLPSPVRVPPRSELA